jgi:LPS sulfotransferase NodH
MKRASLLRPLRAACCAACETTARPADIDRLRPAAEGSSRDYRKFLVLGHQRTGSSMVIGTLRKHPQVSAFGELFIKDRMVFNRPGHQNDSIRLMALRNKYPVEFVERYVFCEHSAETRAVGFKVFPGQLERTRFQPVLEWIGVHTEIRAIIMTRSDLLAAYTSYQVARKDGRFGIEDARDRAFAQIHIDADDFVRVLTQTTAHVDSLRRLLADHDVLELSYEQVTTDLPGRFAEMQAFLGLDPHDLDISSVKKETRPLPEVIVNYSELKDQFKDTEWERFFTA